MSSSIMLPMPGRYTSRDEEDEEEEEEEEEGQYKGNRHLSQRNSDGGAHRSPQQQTDSKRKRRDTDTLVIQALRDTGQAVRHVKEASQYIEKNLMPPDYVLYPVEKQIQVGKRGGGYYIKRHPDGRETRVYLKKYQREQCSLGSLPGSGNTCPAHITGYGTRKPYRAAIAAERVLEAEQRRRTALHGRARTIARLEDRPLPPLPSYHDRMNID